MYQSCQPLAEPQTPRTTHDHLSGFTYVSGVQLGHVGAVAAGRLINVIGELASRPWGMCSAKQVHPKGCKLGCSGGSAPPGGDLPSCPAKQEQTPLEVSQCPLKEHISCSLLHKRGGCKQKSPAHGQLACLVLPTVTAVCQAHKTCSTTSTGTSYCNACSQSSDRHSPQRWERCQAEHGRGHGGCHCPLCVLSVTNGGRECQPHVVSGCNGGGPHLDRNSRCG
jgi:hypothetical protein